MTDKKIVKKEVRYSFHIAEKYGKNPDLHYVKEYITYEDGTSEPRCFLVKDFQRPIWITKKAHQNYEQKREFEKIDETNEYTTTQSNLDRTVARALGKEYLINNKHELYSSPYIYGGNVTSTSYIKYLSLKKNNFIQSKYSVAAFDIETSIETKEIILVSLSTHMNGVYHIYLGINPSFINETKIDEKTKAAIDKYIPHMKNYELEIYKAQNEVDMLNKVFEKANSWAPDFLAIWNINYDIPFILERLSYYNIDPTLVLCDKNIPQEYRYCRYRRGTQKKVTASGVIKPVNPASQWHTLYLTARFYVIDAMCAYKHIRNSDPEKPSYSLDSILDIELGRRKIKFEETSKYVGEKWHSVMQKNYKIEYIVYNIYDTIGMLELEEKTNDLSYSLPSSSGISDFDVFNRNPKKNIDAMFIYGLQRGIVPGTVAPRARQEEIEETEDEEEFDEDDINNNKTLDLTGWIVTLRQNYLIPNGLQIYDDFPYLKTNIRGLVYDSDVSGAYPNATMTANVSKATTHKEIIDIENIPEVVFRQQNLNIITGKPNSIEYCTEMFNLPNPQDLIK